MNNAQKKIDLHGRFFFVRLTGLEPARRETLDPKSSASTNSATGAKPAAKVIHFAEMAKLFPKFVGVKWRFSNSPLASDSASVPSGLRVRSGRTGCQSSCSISSLQCPGMMIW